MSVPIEPIASWPVTAIGAISMRMSSTVYPNACWRSSVWLTGFDLTAGGTSLTVNGRTLDPDGVPRYLQRLRSEVEAFRLEARDPDAAARQRAEAVRARIALCAASDEVEA